MESGECRLCRLSEQDRPSAKWSMSGISLPEIRCLRPVHTESDSEVDTIGWLVTVTWVGTVELCHTRSLHYSRPAATLQSLSQTQSGTQLRQYYTLQTVNLK